MRGIQAPGRVVLYTRAGCHLCDGARKSLGRLGIDWDEVDVDQDAELLARLGERVPVIERAGRIVAEGNLSDVPLGRLLRK